MTRSEQLDEIVNLVKELAHEVRLSNDYSGGVDTATFTFMAGLEGGFDKNGRINLKKVKVRLLEYKKNLRKAA